MTYSRTKAFTVFATGAIVLPVLVTLATTTTAGAVPPAACGTDVATRTFTQSTPVAISTGAAAVVTSSLVVGGAASYLSDVDVATALRHTFSDDLDVTLTSPAGTVVTLTSDNGNGEDNVFNGTVWDDDANPGGQVPYTANDGMVNERTYVNLVAAPTLTPEEPLGAFIGENPNGTWTLTISDDNANDGGTLDGWSLAIDAARCDTAVTGAKVKAKKPKVTLAAFKVRSEVRASAEALTATVAGKVKVKLPNGRNATYKLVQVTRKAPLGGKAGLKQVLAGSKATTAAARAAMVAALKAERKVMVKLRFVVTDAAGNTLVVKRSVKVRRG